MEFTTVLLVQCYGKMQHRNAEPLSVETLAGAVKQKYGSRIAVEIAILDERDDPNGTVLARQVAMRSDVHIIGVSIPQSTYNLSLSFLKNLNLVECSPIIVVGHALPSHTPELFLDKFPNLLIVRSWGESALLAILEQYWTGKPIWSKVPNLVFQQDGIITTTSIEWPRVPPSPLRITPSRFFQRIESSRGCHYDICTFCTRQLKEQGSLRWLRFPYEAVVQELSSIKAMGVTDFTFADDDFIGDDLEGAKEIARAVKSMGGMRFSLNVRVDNVLAPNEPNEVANCRHRLFQLLVEAGLSFVFMGVESLSDTQLKRYGKGIRAIDSIRAARVIEALGLPMELSFILFDPLLSIAELKENIEWLEKSPLWKYVGHLFHSLRVQRDSAYPNVLKDRGLLGDYNPDTMAYEYTFQDPIVGKIAAICSQWKDEVVEIYALARNVQRTTFGDSNLCSVFVHDYRLLQLDVLKALVEASERSEPIELDPSFLARRGQIISKLRRGLLYSNDGSSVLQDLLFETERFQVHEALNT